MGFRFVFVVVDGVWLIEVFFSLVLRFAMFVVCLCLFYICLCVNGVLVYCFYWIFVDASLTLLRSPNPHSLCG